MTSPASDVSWLSGDPGVADGVIYVVGGIVADGTTARVDGFIP